MPGYVRKNHQNSNTFSSSQHQPFYNPKPVKRFPDVYAPRTTNYDGNNFEPVSYPQRDEPPNPNTAPKPIGYSQPRTVGYAQPVPVIYPQPVDYAQREPLPRSRTTPETNNRPVEYPQRVAYLQTDPTPIPRGNLGLKPEPVENPQTEPKPSVVENAQPKPKQTPNPSPTTTNYTAPPVGYTLPRVLVNPQPRPVVYRQPIPAAYPEGYPQPGPYYYPQPGHNPYAQPSPPDYQHNPYSGHYYHPNVNPYDETRPVLNVANPQYVSPIRTIPTNTCPFGKPATCANYYHDLGFDLKSQLCSYQYILLLEIGRVNDVLEETYNHTSISYQCGMAKVIRSQKGFIRNFAPKLYFTNLMECYSEYLHLKSYILVVANIPSFIQASNGQIIGIQLSKNVHVLSFTQKTVGEINAILNNCLSKGSQPLPLRFLTADGKKSDYYECPQKNECPKCLKNTPLAYEDLYCTSQYATVVALGLDYTHVNANSTELIFKQQQNIIPSIVYGPTADTYASINVQKISYLVDKDDMDYAKCYRETLRILYDVSYNNIPTVVSRDINTYIPSKCDCYFLKSDPGYYLILSQTPVVDPSYNLMQLGKGYVILPLPIGTLTLPKCRPDYQKIAQDNLLFAEKNVPISTKPREVVKSDLLPKAAPLVQCLAEPTCAHCLTHFTKELEYEYCQADFVYIFNILNEPGVDYQSAYSPEISVASAPTYTKLRIHGSYQHPLGQDDYEPSHRHRRDTNPEPLQCLNGFIYSECAPAPGCEPTCDSFYNIHCYKRTCHRGCVCPDGMVRKENHCVRPKDCVHQSDGAQCYSGKMQVLFDLKKQNDSGQIVKYFIGGFCSCQYLEYPIGSALIFSRKTPLRTISQLNDDFHIVNLPDGQTDLPVCPNAHHHQHHHHATLDNYNQFHAHPHSSHPHPESTNKKTCPLSQPKTCLICERETPNSCAFDDVMKVLVIKLPTPQECGEVQLLELYTDSKHVPIQFSITMIENCCTDGSCCNLSQGEEVILFTKNSKWVVKDAYTSGLVLDSEVVLVKHSYTAASQIRGQRIQCQHVPQEKPVQVPKNIVMNNQTNQGNISGESNYQRQSKLMKPPQSPPTGTRSISSSQNTETKNTNEKSPTITQTPTNTNIRPEPYGNKKRDSFGGNTTPDPFGGYITSDPFGGYSTPDPFGGSNAPEPYAYTSTESDPYPSQEPAVTEAIEQDTPGGCSDPSGECPECSTRVNRISVLNDVCKIDYILKVELTKIPKAAGWTSSDASNCGDGVVLETLHGDPEDFPGDNLISFTMDSGCSCKQLSIGYEVIMITMKDQWEKKRGKLYELKVVGTTGILDTRRYNDIKDMLSQCF